MSRNAKIAIGAFGGLLLLCMCACVGAFVLLPRVAGPILEQSFSEDPAVAQEAAGEIATFDLPPGYEGAFSMNMLGFNLAAFSTDTGEPVIMLMQFPGSAQLDSQEMEEQMRSAMDQQFSNDSIQLQEVGSETVTIRGEETTLVIREGMDEENQVAMRQVSGTFQGNGGPAMLMIVGPVDLWDESQIDAFIDSIR